MSKSLVYFQWPSWIFWHFRLLHLGSGLHFPLCLRLHPGHRPSAWQTTNSQSYQWRSPWEIIFWSSHWGPPPTTNNYWSIGDSEPSERSHCKIWEQRSSKIYLDNFYQKTTITEPFFNLISFTIIHILKVYIYKEFLIKTSLQFPLFSGLLIFSTLDKFSKL